MEVLHIIAVRAAPALASGLITVGVASDHAEVIALGVVTAMAVLIEGGAKWGRKKGWW